MDKLLNVPLEDELQSNYVDYAMSVIIGRAIPDARDGLKPVQRRILYSMYNLNNTHDQPTKKSARIVGECFAKDTLVLTDRGLVPIQNIERGDSVYTQKGLDKVSEIYIMPRRKLLKIKLGNGIESMVTASQQFKIFTKDWRICWKKANELDVGDYILTKSFYPDVVKEISLGDKKLNENIAYLLGQLLSDGWIANDNDRGYHRVGFCSMNLGVINAINKCLKEEFDYTPTIENKVREYEAANGQIMLSRIYQLRINRSEINKFFIETFDLLGCKSWSKRIPNEIFRSPKRVIFALLSGLIDGNGHIKVDRNEIQYATTSEEMSNQLMILMQHLGIHGKKYTTKHDEENYYILGRKVKKLHESFSLEFHGINARTLAENLDLKEENKREAVEELLKCSLSMCDYDILPWGGEKIFAELSKYHIGSEWYQDAKRVKFRSGIKYKTGSKIRYSSDLYNTPLHISQIADLGIQKKLNKLGSPLASLVNSIIQDRIFFSQVVSVEDGGEDVTYDIQVNTAHEFVANSMISHNCMGKFHPHGNMAIYDALVRMAQPFSMNHILVEGQGNFGSVDGDPPAAERYTEVRLTKLAEMMLEDLERETVQFMPNFDNTEQEPTILPAMLPNLLVNGASGIAVGVATSMPPHNLAEVCDGVLKMLENAEVTADEMLGIIKGPDFPTGGSVLMTSNAYSGYRHGRGQVSIKAKAEIDAKKNKIIITEIPFNVNKSTLIENIAHLVRDKKLVGISDLRDESDKEGISIVIDLKKDSNPESVLNSLFKHTQLEVTFPIINLAVIGNSLRTFSVLQLLKAFIDHRRDIIRKRSTYELNIAKERLHIVEGLLITINKIEDVVKLIRKSKEIKDARENLMHSYELSEKQANAILDMKLSKLTHLESDTLSNEHKELETKIIHYKGILEDPKKVDALIKDETTAIKKNYGRERRTLILKGEEEAEIEEEDMISNQKETIILTNSGYVKRLDLSNYKEQGRGGKGVIVINLKEKDYVKEILTGYTKDYLICISDKGQAYWLKIYKIPEGSRYAEGKAIVNLLDIKDEKIITLFSVKDFENSKLLFLTKNGLIKKVHGNLFARPRSSGIRAITINSNDEVIGAITYSADNYILIFTKKGKAIKFEELDLRFIGRTAMGVRGIKLKVGDSAEGIVAGDNTGYVLTITENGFGKLTDIGRYRLQNRGGGGVINIKTSEKTGNVAKVLFIKSIDEASIVLVNSHGVAITIPLDSIRITGRAAKGVRLMKLETGAKIVDARVLDREEKVL